MRPSLYWCLYEEEFEDNKGVIRICKSKKDRPHKGQKKDKQWSKKTLHRKLKIG
jgi:hypothetical protein